MLNMLLIAIKYLMMVRLSGKLVECVLSREWKLVNHCAPPLAKSNRTPARGKTQNSERHSFPVRRVTSGPQHAHHPRASQGYHNSKTTDATPKHAQGLCSSRVWHRLSPSLDGDSDGALQLHTTCMLACRNSTAQPAYLMPALLLYIHVLAALSAVIPCLPASVASIQTQLLDLMLQAQDNAAV